MKCRFCKRFPAIIDCKFCERQFCSGCIQLEIHGCENISAKKENLINELKTKLIAVKASKL